MRELLDTAMQNWTTHRRENKEEVVRLLFCHKYSTIIYFRNLFFFFSLWVNANGLSGAEESGPTFRFKLRIRGQSIRGNA